jgi:mannose-6-phosphate isomerase-like protein (cupin superfamily)
MSNNYKENRPWGTFENLVDKEYCKVKEIVIMPGQAPSYQFHYKRNETWIIVKGAGTLTLDDEITPVQSGDTIQVPVGTKHRLRNTSNEELVFIEVQWGEYFGEDDIVRIEDDYNRTQETT